MSHRKMPRVSLALLLALGACQGNGVQQPDKMPGGSNTRSAARPVTASTPATSSEPTSPVKPPAEPASVSMDRFLEPQGRKTLTVNFEGKGIGTRIVHGRFRDTFSPDSQGVVVLNTLYHEKRPMIEKGDSGIVILPANASGKPALLQVGEAEFMVPVRGSRDALECWKPRAGEDGVFIGREDASGILYFRGGWRWAFCGD